MTLDGHVWDIEIAFHQMDLSASEEIVWPAPGDIDLQLTLGNGTPLHAKKVEFEVNNAESKASASITRHVDPSSTDFLNAFLRQSIIPTLSIESRVLYGQTDKQQRWQDAYGTESTTLNGNRITSYRVSWDDGLPVEEFSMAFEGIETTEIEAPIVKNQVRTTAGWNVNRAVPTSNGRSSIPERQSNHFQVSPRDSYLEMIDPRNGRVLGKISVDSHEWGPQQKSLQLNLSPNLWSSWLMLQSFRGDDVGTLRFVRHENEDVVSTFTMDRAVIDSWQQSVDGDYTDGAMDVINIGFRDLETSVSTPK